MSTVGDSSRPLTSVCRLLDGFRYGVHDSWCRLLHAFEPPPHRTDGGAGRHWQLIDADASAACEAVRAKLEAAGIRTRDETRSKYARLLEVLG